MKIPVIINNRNLLTWTKSMVEKIKTYDNVGDVIIIDNKSTYEPLLEWYKTNPCEIVYCDNLGHYGAWNSGIVNKLNCEYYVVSPSDEFFIHRQRYNHLIVYSCTCFAFLVFLAVPLQDNYLILRC